MAIRLDSVDSIDSATLARLAEFEGPFKEAEYHDELFEIRGIAEMAEQLDGFVRKSGIVGYHFTRAFPEVIATGMAVGEWESYKLLADYGLHCDGTYRRSWDRP